MRILLTLLILSAASLALACAREERPETPFKTFETYIKALKKKDTTTMKLLLSGETLKAHEQEAKAMGVTVDEIVKRESIFAEGQKVVEFRNEKIDGESATLEVKNAGDKWETVFFLLENGKWKIDKKGYTDQLIREIEKDNQIFDEQNNIDPFPPAGNMSSPPPIGTPTPSTSSEVATPPSVERRQPREGRESREERRESNTSRER